MTVRPEKPAAAPHSPPRTRPTKNGARAEARTPPEREPLYKDTTVPYIAAIDTPMKCSENAAMVSVWNTSWKPNQRGEKSGRFVP